MAECNWCDSKKWFFQLNRSGLCAECAPTVQADIDAHVEALDTAAEPAANADWQSWLAHYDGIRAHISALLRLEGRGIPSLDPPPSAAMVDNDEARAQVILAAARSTVEAGLAAAETAPSSGQRRAAAEAVLGQVNEFQKLLGEPLPEFGDNNATVLVKLEKQVAAFIEETPPS